MFSVSFSIVLNLSSFVCIFIILVILVAVIIIFIVAGTLYNSLIYAVVKAAATSTCYRYLYPSRPILDVKAINARGTVVSKLLGNLPRGLSNDKSNIPFRFFCLVKNKKEIFLRAHSMFLKFRPFCCVPLQIAIVVP